MTGDDVIGVVLAGGAARRLGGAKATAQLAGRPLISYPLAALRSVLAEVAVVTKAGVTLPPLPGVAVWTEPGEPQHPLVGIVHALERAGGRPVLVCAADLPFVDAALVRSLLAAGPGETVVAACDGGLQPLLGLYRPSALGVLRAAAAEGSASVRAVVSDLGPMIVEVDACHLFNVNTPTDLAEAAQRLSRT